MSAGLNSFCSGKTDGAQLVQMWPQRLTRSDFCFDRFATWAAQFELWLVAVSRPAFERNSLICVLKSLNDSNMAADGRPPYDISNTALTAPSTTPSQCFALA